VLVSHDPAFLIHRLAARFGLPVLPEWAEWFAAELQAHRAVRPLIGLGCAPILVLGTKKRFLGWIGHALKRGRIPIPDANETTPWRVPSEFPIASADQTDDPVHFLRVARLGTLPIGLKQEEASHELCCDVTCARP
jgi:hypothetical protein